MPGVALLPNTPPGTGAFNSNTGSSSGNLYQKQSTFPALNSQNGIVQRRDQDLTVAEIKEKAKEGVNKEARGVSAISLIKTARTQILSAKEQEARGDLKSAFGSYIKAATLAKMTMESPEYVQESKGKGGVIRKELNDFLGNDGKDISARTSAVEEKLKAIEKAHAGETKESIPGGSIADRLRALQDNGLSLGPTKLRERESPNLPTPPISPNFPSHYTHNNIPNSSSSISHAPSSSSSNHNHSHSQSMHALVSPSTFGPPSPSSTPSSSPSNGSILNNYDITGFTQAFPSIDELDEDPSFSLPSLPSVPTGVGSTNVVLPNKLRNPNGIGEPPTPSALGSFRIYTAPIERPSSTPITPTNHNFSSRPSSPTSSSNSNNKSTVPAKPSGLSNGVTVNSVPKPSSPIPNKNTAFPKDLLAYIREHNVLVIDVRNRADFDREHIRANAIVCIEPSVLMRDNVDAESIENSMVIGPRQEASLFANRDKFELVAFYDSSSTTFGDASSPLSVLLRVIKEQAFKKFLKRMPMMLIGGIEAWKREVGEGESVLVRGSMDIQRPVPTRGMGISSALLSSGVGAISSSISAGPSVSNHSTGNHHEVWTPPRQAEHRSTMSMSSEYSGHTRMPADAVYSGNYPPNTDKALQRRPAVLRPSSNSISYTRSLNDTISPLMSSSTGSGSFPNGPSSASGISYPQFPRHMTPTASGSGPINNSNNPFSSSSPAIPSPGVQYDITSPPQAASINPSSQLSRRRTSDFVDQSQEALAGSMSALSLSGAYSARLPGPTMIDYPELTSPPSTSTIIPRPPPVASSTMERERMDNRPRVQQTAPFSPTPPSSAIPISMSNSSSMSLGSGPKPPRIQSDYPVSYWADVHIGTSGLKNLGNTCYMNAPIQCLSATLPFSRFFQEGRWKSAVNYTNPLGSKGKLTGAFANLLHEMWAGDMPYLAPIDFRRMICSLKSQYNGSDQHDSQEFLSFLIDGIHEDLNRIIARPNYTPTPEEEAELERLPPQIASEREWRAWRSRNDSIIVDFFQGQFRNRMECLTCHTTSTTYNVFSILQLPIPNSRSGKVSIERCLDAFFNEEVLEKDDAWDCPKCKTKRRASKKLSLARLPPILMVHLKRFEANGRISDKIDTFVDFPVKGLDLTNYMPPPLPPGVDRSQLNGGMPLSLEDPQTQLPPYRYDLYGVTNHYGHLTSGHYTAFIASRGGWMYCDDSSVKVADAKQVVSQKAYVLFYKRVR